MQLDDKYIEYFVDILTNQLDIAVCLIFGSNVLHGPCRRKFLVKQVIGSNFKLFDNGESKYHDGSERCWFMRNVKRQIVSKCLVKKNPEDYPMFCQHGVNEALLDRGHLQELASSTTSTKIRNDELVKTLECLSCQIWYKIQQRTTKNLLHTAMSTVHENNCKIEQRCMVIVVFYSKMLKLMK